MTEQTCLQQHQQRLQNYRKFEKETVKPFLEELWYLRVPAFTAVLCNIYSVLLLIWKYLKSPRGNENNDEVDDDRISNSKATALLFLPSILGFLPLLALGFGLFRTLLGEGFGLFGTESIITWVLGILLIFLIIVGALCLYLSKGIYIVVFYALPLGLLQFLFSIIITNRPQCGKPIFNQNSIFNSIFNPDIGCQLPPLLNLFFAISYTIVLLFWYFALDISRGEVILKEESKQPTSQSSDSFFNLNPSSDLLFKPFLVVFSSSLSIIAFSIFSFPLITNELAKLFAIIFFLVLLFLISKLVDLDNWKICLILFCSVIVLLLVAFKCPNLASSIGSIDIISVFLITFLTLGSMIFYWGHTSRIPWITILLIWVLAVGFFNGNDNHHFRKLPSKKNYSILPLETQFEKWIESRKNEILAFKSNNKEYPIYLVSAQGGGIFAAYHAASTLSRLQDLCPAFAHHVFAISGVSGGSLGATAFSSLVNSVQPQFTQKCPGRIKNKLTKDDDYRGILEKYAHQLLNQDFLSPLLAAGLFPDFFQRFFPVPIEAVDRARGLEYAFEQGWDSITSWNKKEHPNLLKNSYYDHWNPESAAPALVLNTTVVETGERLLLSPFTFKTPGSSNVKFSDLVDISTVTACQDQINFPLSTAAFLSARFPFVTPVGWFNKCNSKSRLADGGYFENSGFSTAFEIGQGLQEILEDKCEHKTFKDITCKYKASKDTTSKKDNALRDNTFKVVYLALTDNSRLKQQSVGGDLFSPINALFNSREARGRSIIEQAEYKIDGKLKDDDKKEVSKHRFRQFYLTHFQYREDDDPRKEDDDPRKHQVNVCPLGSQPKDCQSLDVKSNFQLPLGWYLSKFSQDYIRDRIGNPIACTGDNNYQNANNNHCVMESVIHELKEWH